MTGFVLLSGGVDSTTLMVMAMQKENTVVAISADYGQRHHRELDAVRDVTSHYFIPRYILPLAGIIPKTLLTDPSREIPNQTYAELRGRSPAYVPFRNGLMIAAATALIEGLIDDKHIGLEVQHHLYFGAHREDGEHYAYNDCTPPFVIAMNLAIRCSTYDRVTLRAPFLKMDKADIIRLGAKHGIDYSMTWSCYAGGEVHCGKCPSCHARRAAFTKTGVSDPTKYQTAEEKPAHGNT